MYQTRRIGFILLLVVRTVAAQPTAPRDKVITNDDKVKPPDLHGVSTPAPRPAPIENHATVVDPAFPWVGAGISDITGPVAEVGMMGYAQSDQKTAGLKTRLFARAFVFAEGPDPGQRRVVFVNLDLGNAFHAVRLGVLKKLAGLSDSRGRPLSSFYTDANVMLSAIHTHDGPGGTSHHLLYNFTVLGFIEQNYVATVDGIVEAIVAAHESLIRDGRAVVRIAIGELDGASANRSLPAYLAGIPGGAKKCPGGSCPPDVLRASVDRTVTQLRLDRLDGTTFGLLNWFAVHNTSMSQKNLLVSSDNKGLAALEVEARRASIGAMRCLDGRLCDPVTNECVACRNDIGNPGRFVAGFAQSNEGDVTPNVYGGEDGRGVNEVVALNNAAHAQSQKAEELLKAAKEEIGLPVDYRHTYVYMPGLDVPDARYGNGLALQGKTGPETRRLCSKGAYGASFAAGAEDGRSGVKGFVEGIRQSDGHGWVGNVEDTLMLWDFIPAILNVRNLLKDWLRQEDDPCHWPKPVLIPLDNGFSVRANHFLMAHAVFLPADVLAFTAGARWGPETLPFQLFRFGPLVIAGVPAELTTLAGRDLRRLLLDILGPKGVKYAVIAGLSNEYSGYVTTVPEYDQQQYEGASTMFGRLTFEAYRQEFRKLAEAMRDGKPVQPGPAPEDDPLVARALSAQTGVVRDGRTSKLRIGEVIHQPKASYRSNEPVSVTFLAGHPKNDLRRNSSYVFVEHKLPDGRWQLVATDSMPELQFSWDRNVSLADAGNCEGTIIKIIGDPGFQCSNVRVRWMPYTATPGTYRIRHIGKYKPDMLSNERRPYSGVTREFQIINP